jgi:type I restriction enzyme R subunit
VRRSDEEARPDLAHAGSGKTFTLLTTARLMLEDKERFQNATVILVVDRIELEGQLSGWVDRLLGEMQQQDIAVERAGTRADLQRLLDADFRGLIISMIHKFEAIRKDSCTRDNVYVFIDEAHRSVAKKLGTYLMAAVPTATIVGFTGTPIDKTAQGEGTFKIFGYEDEKGYLDKYSIKESIEDETTLPIKHVLAPSEMTVPVDRLDKEFFELAKDEGITDIEELNRVLDRAVALRTFLKADDRVAKVAAFVAEHFKENVLPLGYKAFVVAADREACAKYKRALDELLPPEWTEPRLYRERLGHRRPATGGAAPAQRRTRGRRARLVQEGVREPKDPDRHRQAADRLRRATALLPIPGQADA